MKLLRLVVCLSLIFSFAWIANVTAADFPAKQMTFCNWGDPGSGWDNYGRLISILMEKHFGVTVKYVSKTGGNTNEIMQYVMQQPADGNTIIGFSNSLSGFMNFPGYIAKPTDFDTVINLEMEPYLLFVNSESEFKTLEDFIAYAKKNPGKLSVSGSRVGSIHHQNMVGLAREAGIETSWIPARGAGDVLKDLLGKHISAGVFGPATGLAQMKAGLIRPLVIFDTERYDDLPKVPSLKEKGVKFEGYPIYHGVMLRKGVPDDRKKIIVKKFREIYDDEKLTERVRVNAMKKLWFDPVEFTQTFYKSVEETKVFLTNVGILKK
jgi:putative tricarboxylic transport membrane protein